MTTETLERNVKEWSNLLHSLHAHVQVLWGSPMVIPQNDVESTWLHQFADLNEERMNDTSLADMLYVIRCYMIVVRNHAAIDSMNAKPSIADLFTEVKLLGMNSTKECRSYYPDAEHLARLELCVAYYIVMEFSNGADSVKAGTAVSDEWKKKERAARCLDFRPPAEQAVKDGVVAATTTARPEDVQPGTWWIGKSVKTFVSFCSRVFHKVHTDATLLRSLSPRTDDGVVLDEVASPANRLRLQKWLKERAAMQQPNEFLIRLRNTVFEAALPMHSRYAAMSRRSSRMEKISSTNALLQHESGFQVLNRLHSLLSTKLTQVADDAKHELHVFFLIVSLHQQLMQSTKDKFMGVFYIDNQSVTTHSQLADMIHTPTIWGSNKRPVIVEIERAYHVLDVSGPDDYERATEESLKRVQHVKCVDMYQAVLYWSHLMHTKYKDELLSGANISAFYESFLPILDRRL